jgi:N6-L-threonylcarbamoyladenine synthase
MARFLGIDTSCYTTSAAVYDSSGEPAGEERIVLSVKEGNRGLSQSQMVFQHTRNLPVILQKLSPLLQDIKGIGVSSFPRRRADSYMPAFLVGKGAAFSLAAALHVPVYEFSHQENHALAAISKHPSLWGKPFYMMHMSGGTMDVLSALWQGECMEITTLMDSKDITAGQLIDRVGVALGLHFPCGKELEKLALAGHHTYHIPRSAVKGAFSFSGPETKVQRDIASGKYTREDIAEGVLEHIGKALDKELSACPFEKRPFIAVGGVMANKYLRHKVEEIMERKGIKVYFADVETSSDNATGNAFGAYMRAACGG